MRIAMLHSFYSSAMPSGENNVVSDQVQALRDAGHDVLLVARRTDEEQEKIAYALRTAWSVGTGTGYDPTEELRDWKPDVVHIHNLFPNFASRWAYSWDGPIVHSLQNYRYACGNGLLFRDGQVCWECPNHGAWQSVKHGCYHHSRLASIPVAASRAVSGRDLMYRMTRVISTSRFSDGVARRLLPHIDPVLIPNFVEGDELDGRPEIEDRWVALGRMTAEKGLVELAALWPQTEDLTLVGDGPLFNEAVTAAAGKRIDLRHAVPRDEMRTILAGSQALIFPSRWLEVAPQIPVESMRLGVPVIALETNGVAQLVRETGTGSTYRDELSLMEALDEVRRSRSAMSQRALNLYESDWSKGAWLDRMVGLYEEILVGR